MIRKKQRVETPVFQVILIIVRCIYQIDPFSPEFHDPTDDGLLVRWTGGVSCDDPGTFGGHRTAGGSKALEGYIRILVSCLALKLHKLLIDMAEGAVFCVHP